VYWIASGTTDQYVYFVRNTGRSSFTVYRARNGAAPVQMTTPTITESDSTNMPGHYEFLLDEDMTMTSGNLTESMVFYITAAGMQPVTIEVVLFDPANWETQANLVRIAGSTDLQASGTGGQSYGTS